MKISKSRNIKRSPKRAAIRASFITVVSEYIARLRAYGLHPRTSECVNFTLQEMALTYGAWWAKLELWEVSAINNDISGQRSVFHV